ncbi:MAG: type II 3-dehydroquinate dehydratase [Candidatus Cloacimonadota bacterium]|nr:MAG: type II 3-dehydroquinate dehydratase [Candidatus Cloacimonadota bacterium]
MRILVINGPNLNLLGTREIGIYGKQTIQELEKYIKDWIKCKNVELRFYQFNSEGEIIDCIQSNANWADGIIINPAGYSNTSIAIYDCIKGIDIPTIEVHLSNVFSREEFRKKLVIAGACIGVISGFGFNSYILALEHLITKLR